MWKSRTMDGFVAIEYSEEATLRCSVKGYISRLLCYVYEVWLWEKYVLQCEGELDNVKDCRML